MLSLQFDGIAIAAKYNLLNTQCVDVHTERLTCAKISLSNHKCKIVVHTASKKLLDSFLLPIKFKIVYT